VLKAGVRSNQEQLLFPEWSCGESVGFSVCGVVDVAEFLSKLVKAKSDHVPTGMLLSYESYAAPLIFFGDHIC